jgi:hypothetical protein
MNIKELAFEAGLTITPCGLFEAEDTNLERFAELVRADERAEYVKQFITDADRDENIRSEERKHCAADYLKIMRDAVAREREACALLCEEWYLSGDVAKAIRARGNE